MISSEVLHKKTLLLNQPVEPSDVYKSKYPSENIYEYPVDNSGSPNPSSIRHLIGSISGRLTLKEPCTSTSLDSQSYDQAQIGPRLTENNHQLQDSSQDAYKLYLPLENVQYTAEILSPKLEELLSNLQHNNNFQQHFNNFGTPYINYGLNFLHNSASKYKQNEFLEHASGPRFGSLSPRGSTSYLNIPVFSNNENSLDGLEKEQQTVPNLTVQQSIGLKLDHSKLQRL